MEGGDRRILQAHQPVGLLYIAMNKRPYLRQDRSWGLTPEVDFWLLHTHEQVRTYIHRDLKKNIQGYLSCSDLDWIPELQKQGKKARNKQKPPNKKQTTNNNKIKEDEMPEGIYTPRSLSHFRTLPSKRSSSILNQNCGQKYTSFLYNPTKLWHCVISKRK